MSTEHVYEKRRFDEYVERMRLDAISEEKRKEERESKRRRFIPSGM